MELQYHVEQLQGRYVECIDDNRLEEWPEFFMENCVYEIILEGEPRARLACRSDILRQQGNA